MEKSFSGQLLWLNIKVLVNLLKWSQADKQFDVINTQVVKLDHQGIRDKAVPSISIKHTQVQKSATDTEAGAGNRLKLSNGRNFFQMNETWHRIQKLHLVWGLASGHLCAYAYTIRFSIFWTVPWYSHQHYIVLSRNAIGHGVSVHTLQPLFW